MEKFDEDCIFFESSRLMMYKKSKKDSLDKKLDEMMQDDEFNVDSQELHLERFARFLVAMYEKYAEKIDINYD